ncbi:MAG: DUF2828 family protein [Acholeplasmatales bacterium]|jgi:hypothetical protein|nr:DUF2828 family protein [Acholeplasmatales bacterium]
MSLYENIVKITNQTTTTNGDVAFLSTGNFVYDMVALGGGLRNRNLEFSKLFYKAFTLDRYGALKALFYTRDIIDGLGERDLFRTGLLVLGNEFPHIVSSILPFITYERIGRFDDMLILLDTLARDTVLEYIKQEITSSKTNNLVAKWLPSINTSSKVSVRYAYIIAKYLGLSPAEYRKFLSSNRKVVEQQLSSKQFDKIDYSSVPSQANFKYKKAFNRHDGARYHAFLESASKDEAKINTSTLSAYQVTKASLTNEQSDTTEKLVNLTFSKILAKLDDIDSNTIVIRDGSGSMWDYYGGVVKPIDVANALTLVCARKLKGDMNGAFITFSRNAQLVKIPSNIGVRESIKFMNSFGEAANTNIERVYNLILKIASSTDDLSCIPTRLLIISDMQFDEASGYDTKTSNSNVNFNKKLVRTLDKFREKYSELNLALPSIYFWNVNSFNQTVPVGINDKGIYTISGYSEHILNAVIRNKKLDPIDFVKNLLGKYSFIDNLEL